MKIKVSMKKSDPIGVMEVPMKRQTSIRAGRCRQGFTTNDIINYRLPEGILVHHNTARINDRLPEEILFHHIFVRLPTRTLLCCRSVCKAWNRVFCDPQFVRLHLYQQHHKLLVRYPDNRFYSVDYEEGGVWFNLPAEACSRQPQLLGSCNGLVGLSIDHASFSDAKILSLWNPSTGESKRIPDPHPYIRSSETLGFVYDSNFDDYKFVRIVNSHKTCRMDMYSLRNNSWKLIKEAPPRDSEFKHVDKEPGVGVNGYLFWLAFEACELGFITEVLTAKLCLTDYRITVSKLPRELIDCRDGIVQTTRWSMGRGLIAMGNNCLAAYAFHKPGKFVVWTSKLSEKNEETKWEKLITLPLSSPVFFWVFSVRPAWFTKDGKVVLFMQGGYPKQEQEQHKFGLYDPLNKSIQCFRMYGGENNAFDRSVVLTHTESLLSPNMFGCNIEC